MSDGVARGVGARTRDVGVDLYWLPLGAGGHFVRLNGRIFERVQALLQRRPPLDLYHSALKVRVPEGRFIIEQTPIPDHDGASRGVAVEGPVVSRLAARLRVFRYEIRCWRDGMIPDVDEAVESPVRLTSDGGETKRLLDLVPAVPPLAWGRDELGTGEMWNSNSIISWLVATSGLPAGLIRLPANGRAPGWDAGLIAAQRMAGGAQPVTLASPAAAWSTPAARAAASHPPDRRSGAPEAHGSQGRS